MKKWCDIGVCTCFWDVLFGKDHSACCTLHDYNYAKQKITRKEADKRFLKCLRKKTFTVLAFAMFGAVRMFGWWRWNALAPMQFLNDTLTTKKNTKEKE